MSARRGRGAHRGLAETGRVRTRLRVRRRHLRVTTTDGQRGRAGTTSSEHVPSGSGEGAAPRERGRGVRGHRASGWPIGRDGRHVVPGTGKPRRASGPSARQRVGRATDARVEEGLEVAPAAHAGQRRGGNGRRRRAARLHGWGRLWRADASERRSTDRRDRAGNGTGGARRSTETR